MSSVPLLRFWDGARWTSQTRLVDRDPGPGGEKPAPRKKRWWQVVKWGGGVGAFVLAAAVVGIALARGQQVCSVNTRASSSSRARASSACPRRSSPRPKRA